MYATLMDEISKEIQEANLGIKMPNSDEKIGCLLWMDDVILITDNDQEMQTMLDKTDDISKRYHIQFGKDKSKIMKIGPKIPKNNFTLGTMEMEYTDNYKYLGKTLNNKLTMTNHITETKSKAEAAYQTVLAIAGNQNFKEIEMETFWELLKTCIVPIITYAGEVCNPNKAETKKINGILDNIIRRILMVPQTTPREVLYMETGLLDIQTTTDKNRIMMANRLDKNQDKLADKMMKINGKKSWNKQLQQTKETYKITTIDMQGTKRNVKRNITPKINCTFRERIDTDGENKSKVKYLKQGIKTWRPNNKPTYMAKLTRKDCSTIFKARTRMTEIKDNFRGMYTDNICRACGKTNETQEHILDKCPSIHIYQTTTTTKTDAFSEDPDHLKTVAHKIRTTLARIPKNPTNSVQPTNRTGNPATRTCTQ